MRSFVTSKKEELASTTEDMSPIRSDLLTRLVSASESEGKNGLNDTEVVSTAASTSALRPDGPRRSGMCLASCSLDTVCLAHLRV